MAALFCVGTNLTGFVLSIVTTTAKVPHAYEFYHDELMVLNFRLPNLNAAVGCAQMEQLSHSLTSKRRLAHQYEEYFSGGEYTFVKEPEYTRSNYWLNAVVCNDFEHREALLTDTNTQGVMTRPVWKLMHRLPMFKDDIRDGLTNSVRSRAKVGKLT